MHHALPSVTGLIALALGGFAVPPAARAADIPRYARFEATFTSSKDYPNALHDVQVRVEFFGPDAARHTVDA